MPSRAPTRIDLGGGWTDVPPYCEREQGFVCNVAIDRYAVATVEKGTHGPSTERDGKLIDAAVRRSGVADVTVKVASDFPVGAGLGGSSSASAAILGALRAWRALEWDRVAIAEEGRLIEVEDLGIAGGRQDHYAATHGGALALTFTDVVDVRRIGVSDRARAEFERRAIVVYTGESRISGGTITAVLDAYLERDRRVLAALKRMKELAQQMAGELEAGDMDDLGAMIAEHWAFQRQLNAAIPTPLIDKIIAESAKVGALGAKALGASGGGCVLVIARSDKVVDVTRCLESHGTVVPFHVDVNGLAPV